MSDTRRESCGVLPVRGALGTAAAVFNPPPVPRMTTKLYMLMRHGEPIGVSLRGRYDALIDACDATRVTRDEMEKLGESPDALEPELHFKTMLWARPRFT